MDKSRRKFIKKASYAAPAILSMTAMPAMASFGSQEGSAGSSTAEPAVVHPERWQSIERTRYVRRMQRLGLDYEQYGWD